MTENATNPAASVAGYLCQTTPEQAVKLAMELCEQLPGDPEGFHGGVWPGNVTLDGDGRAVLGMPMSTPAAQRPANQVEYLAPEFFWDGDTSAAADVFSVALMIFAGCNKGFLPFQPEKEELSNQDRASALRRRMKGQAIAAPEGVSADLKKVLEKALAYKPEDRYITAKELLFALHWTDEALGPEKETDAAAAAVPAEPTLEAAEAVPEAGAVEQAAEETPAPVIEEPPVPEESTEEMLREADQVLAAAAAGLAAAGGAAAVAAGAAAANRDSEPSDDAESAPADGEAPAQAEDTPTGGTADAPADGEAPDQGSGDAAAPSTVEEAAASDTPTAAAASTGETSAAAAAASTVDAPSAVPTAKKEYKVRKDFETAPDRRAPTVAPAKKKNAKAVPILCGVAAAVLLGGVGYMVFGSHAPQTSTPFDPEATEQVSVEAPPSPLVITPEPTSTAEPTAEPTATPKASPRPTARPDGLVIVTPSPGSLEAAGTAGGAAAGAGSGTSAPSGGGTGTTPGGTGSGTGSGSGTSWGGGSGTGTGGGTSWGGGSGTGSGGGTSWGGGSGTGSGGGTAWGGGSGTGSATTPAPGYTVSPADDTVYITGMGVNVRSGPGTSYPIIGSASTGYQLQRTGLSGNWSRVSFKGTTGFVSNTYLSTTDPTATPATPTPPAGSATPEPTSRYTVTVSDLSYASAKSAAQSSGGLTVIKSEDDFQSVANQLNNGAGAVEYAWLGVEYDSAGSCWRWADGSVLASDDSHWAEGYPVSGDDQVLLAKRGGSWQYISVSSASFDAASGTYSGKLGYVTGS